MTSEPYTALLGRPDPIGAADASVCCELMGHSSFRFDWPSRAAPHRRRAGRPHGSSLRPPSFSCLTREPTRPHPPSFSCLTREPTLPPPRHSRARHGNPRPLRPPSFSCLTREPTLPPPSVILVLDTGTHAPTPPVILVPDTGTHAPSPPSFSCSTREPTPLPDGLPDGTGWKKPDVGRRPIGVPGSHPPPLWIPAFAGMTVAVALLRRLTRPAAGFTNTAYLAPRSGVPQEAAGGPQC